MTYTLITRDAQTIYGWSAELVTPSRTNLAELSQQKQALLDEYQTELTDGLMAVNSNQDGQQHYLVGQASVTKRPSTFTLPAGQYAQFDLTFSDRINLDQLIGRSYGELAQVTGLQIAGNFNLEAFVNQHQVQFFVPVHLLQ